MVEESSKFCEFQFEKLLFALPSSRLHHSLRYIILEGDACVTKFNFTLE